MYTETTYTVYVTGRRTTAAEPESGTVPVRVRATSRRTAVEQVLRDAAEGLRVLLHGRPVVFDEITRTRVLKGAR